MKPIIVSRQRDGVVFMRFFSHYQSILSNLELYKINTVPFLCLATVSRHFLVILQNGQFA